jgi:GntR family transcriptional regulator
MNINISNTSDKPIYIQLFDQISTQILRGELASGFALPSIRTAAKELRVSVITVKKAWEELEHQEFIYTRAGKGCFVAELSETELLNKKNEIVEKKILKDIEYYKAMDLKLSEVIELLEKLY